MNRRSAFVICAILASAIGATGVSAATAYKVFIIAGQSNAAGWNPAPDGAATLPDSLSKPEPNVKIYGICGTDASGQTMGNGCSGTKYAATKGWTALKPLFWGGGDQVGSYNSFGHNMAKLLPNDSIAIIVACDVSTLTADWLPPSQPGGPGAFIPEFFAGIRRGLADLTVYGAGNTGVITGMCWVHGESDAGNSNYGTLLTAFIKCVRDSLKVSTMPFVISKVNPYWDATVVPAQQAAVAKTVPNTAIVETSTFPIANGGHYTATSQVMLGNAFTTAMMGLLRPTGVRENASPRGNPAAGLVGRGITVHEPSTVIISDISGRTLRAATVNPGGEIALCGAGTGVRLVSVRTSSGAESRAVLVRK